MIAGLRGGPHGGRRLEEIEEGTEILVVPCGTTGVAAVYADSGPARRTGEQEFCYLYTRIKEPGQTRRKGL